MDITKENLSKNKKLIFSNDLDQVFKKNILKSHGIVLVIGPKSSEKIKTLYYLSIILSNLNFKVASIENVIKQKIENINQHQINLKIGFTIPVVLRSFLRQNLDAIMLDKLNNQETAKAVLDLALTGHIVLTSLDANNIVEALKKISSFGISQALISTNVNLIISQRSVNKLCPYCRNKLFLNKKIVSDLQKKLNIKTSFENLTLYKRNACNKCNQSGFDGQIEIFSFLENIENLYRSNWNNLESDLFKKNILLQENKNFFKNLFLRAQNGFIDADEILKFI